VFLWLLLFGLQKLHHLFSYLRISVCNDLIMYRYVFRAQKELVEKERREEQEARKKRLGHADEVRAQIREKEQVRISERNNFFEEGVKLDEEARARRAKLEEVKKKKLEALRYAKWPGHAGVHCVFSYTLFWTVTTTDSFILVFVW